MLRKRSTKRLPQVDIPLDVSSIKALNSSYEVRSLLVPDASSSQFGWGAPGSEYEYMHFKTSIAWSAVVLGMAAEKGGHPAFGASGCKTMREYLFFLQQRIPSLKDSLCEQYLGAILFRLNLSFLILVQNTMKPLGSVCGSFLSMSSVSS